MGSIFQRKYSRWVTAHRSCGVQTRKCPETSKWASSHSSLRMVETPMVWTTSANIWNYWLWSLTIPAFTALWALDLGLKKWWGTRDPTVFPHFSLKAYNGGVCWQQDEAPWGSLLSLVLVGPNIRGGQNTKVLRWVRHWDLVMVCDGGCVSWEVVHISNKRWVAQYIDVAWMSEPQGCANW
jgi:hypothetical protein